MENFLGDKIEAIERSSRHDRAKLQNRAVSDSEINKDRASRSNHRSASRIGGGVFINNM